MKTDGLYLMISILCIVDLMFLQAILRLKVRIHRLEQKRAKKDR